MRRFTSAGSFFRSMNVFLKIAAGFLLLFNGTGAIYGGYHLISHPDGSSLQMTVEYLRYSPFDSYLIPGIVLFVMNGILSFAVFIALLSNHRYAARLIAAQGIILTGWIIVQVMMVSSVYYLHFVLGGCGILLMLFGYLLHRAAGK